MTLALSNDFLTRDSAKLRYCHEEYIIPIENLKLIYICLLIIKNDTRSIEFNSKEKRDEFYSKIITKIVDKKFELHELKIKMEEEILNQEEECYLDIDLEIQNEYSKIKRK